MEQVVLNRCRIGHSRLTNSYLINNEERPECIPCNSNYYLRHVLIDCVDVADVRQTFYNVNSLFHLFTNVKGNTILKFKKQIYMQKYSYITYVLNIWFYLFNVFFICTYNPFVLQTSMFYVLFLIILQLNNLIITFVRATIELKYC